MKYCCSRRRPDHPLKSKAQVSRCHRTGFLLLIQTFAGGFAVSSRTSSVLIGGSAHLWLFQAYKCSSACADGQLYHLPFGDSSASLNGTMQSGKSQQSYVPFLLR